MQRGTMAGDRGAEGLKFLFEQHQDGIMQLLYAKGTRRSDKNGVIACNGAENAFRFAQRVQQASNQLRCPGLVWITTSASLKSISSTRFFSGLVVVGTPSPAGKQ